MLIVDLDHTMWTLVIVSLLIVLSTIMVTNCVGAGKVGRRIKISNENFIIPVWK